MSAGTRAVHLFSLLLFLAGTGMLVYAGYSFGAQSAEARARHAGYLRENARVGSLHHDVRELLEYFHGKDSKYPEGLAARLKSRWHISDAEEEHSGPLTTPFQQRLAVFCSDMDDTTGPTRVRGFSLYLQNMAYGAPVHIHIDAKTELVEVGMGWSKSQSIWEYRGYSCNP